MEHKAKYEDIAFFGKLLILINGFRRPVFSYSIIFAWLGCVTGVYDINSVLLEKSLAWSVIIVLISIFGEKVVLASMPIIKMWFGRNGTITEKKV